jgi:uncharacterized protein (DUF924 family)
MDPRAREVVDFWFREVGETGWYAPPEGLDDRVRSRFAELWAEGCAGALDRWSVQPEPCLALLILLDQFPRNMFRGTERAFASDRKARTIAKAAIARGLERRIDAPARQFFYLPLMHSEMVSDQSRCVRLIVLGIGRGENLRHARAHRAVVRRFGRFPYRNAALGRRTTDAEQAWLDRGSYEAELDAIGA